jgi:hypothetical protein
MNGPEEINRERPETSAAEAGLSEFEQSLRHALQRVEVPAETTKKLLALAEESGRTRTHSGRVLAMPMRIALVRSWVGGAIAAVLVLGCFAGARIHAEHERRLQADQQFEAAERITDQTLERTRQQLEQRGIQLDQ